MALPPRESSIRRLWDPSPWDGDLEAYREDLYAGMAFGMPDVRAFAREWLQELLRVGYYGMEESLGLPLKQRSSDFFAPPKPLPLWGEAYPTRIAQTAQTIWIRLDGPRSPERGYREISVSDELLRTDFRIKADHPTVRKMVGRGRRTLKAALGEDGWKEHVRAMTEEALAWRSRSPLQRQAELEAEALGVPYDEVLGRLEEESRQSSQEGRHGIREGVAF